MRETESTPNRIPFPLEGSAGKLLLELRHTEPPTSLLLLVPIILLCFSISLQLRGSHFGTIDTWGWITLCFGWLSGAL